MTSKTYYCELCDKNFSNANQYWYHKNRKTLCIPKDIVLKELSLQKGKLKFFQEKTKDLSKENNHLKKELDYFREIVHNNSKQNSNQIMYQTYNDNTISNLNITNVNHIDIDSLFKLEIAKLEKENISHISPNLLLEVLKCKKFEDTMQQLAKIVYFNPRAPENYRWCIFDKKSKCGAFEYNHDVQMISVRDSDYVIEKNMQSVLGKLLDSCEKLKQRVAFSKVQSKNCDELFAQFGTKMDKTIIDNIKIIAYEDCGIPRSVWKQLKVPILILK